MCSRRELQAAAIRLKRYGKGTEEAGSWLEDCGCCVCVQVQEGGAREENQRSG